MSTAIAFAKKLINVRQQLHELADKIEKIAREIDTGVNVILDADTAGTAADDGDFYRDDFHLKRTCYACPEQYDAYYGKEDVPCAYFRLRNGRFTVQVPDVEGEIVYEATDLRGDGIFYTAEERLFHLMAGIDAVKTRLLRMLRQ